MFQDIKRFLVDGLALHVVAGIFILTQPLRADPLPVFTTQPTNQIVSPGQNPSLVVAATGATDFQWRFNGVDIPGATGSVLQLTNAQATNSGYYLALAKNSSGWVPSTLAYLSVVNSPGGKVPLLNSGNSLARAISWDGQPISSGWAQVMAGPELDQMQPAGTPAPVSNGYFIRSSGVSVANVEQGQPVYYRVDVTYSGVTQTSTVLKLVAGGSLYPTPSAGDLRFPIYLEWPDQRPSTSRPLQQVRVPGETVKLSFGYGCFIYYGLPTLQWRKDGVIISAPATCQTNINPYYVNYDATLTITNIQANDAGVYDFVLTGANGFVSPKFAISMLSTNGQGLIRSARIDGSNFAFTMDGAPTRNYMIQWSTNLSVWNNLMSLSNVTGRLSFSNALPSDDQMFYRASLLAQ